MSKRLLLSAVSSLLIAFGSITTAWAQGSTGLIDGQLVDAAGVGVAGAQITVSDASTGLSRTATSTSSGHFKMQLPPGVYELNSSKSGYSTVTIEQVAVNLGTTTTLTIPVQDASIEEITTYGTATSLMPAATGETGLNISLEELSQVPVNRNIEAVALLAPGTVAGDTAFGDDKTLVSFGGASVAENVYYIDGLNVTNFRNGLGGASVPFEFYDQFQIKTGGYGAEFGRSTGGVLNAVTKRGTNEWEYGVVSYADTNIAQGTSPNTLRADGTLYDLNSENEQTSMTTDIYIGGAIIKDHLFFYALYEIQETNADFNSLGSPSTWNEQTIDDDFWGGNITWQVTDNHAFSYTTFTDERTIFTEQYRFDVDAKKKGDFVGSATSLRGGENNIFRYDGNFGDNFVVSAMYGKNEYNLTSFSSNDQACPLIIDLQDDSTDVFGAGSCWVDSTIDSASFDEREAYRIDFELYLGNHTIRAGFDREDNFSSGSTVYPGFDYNPVEIGGQYYRYETYDGGTELSNGGIVPGVIGDGTRVDTIRTRYFQNGGDFDTIQQAWYIEDRWDINDAFTVQVGLRNEAFDNKNSLGDSFIKLTDQWAPRLAMEWSPGGTGDQVITLNWGRYHLPIAANTNLRLAGPELDYQRYFLDCGTRDEAAAPTCIGADGQPTTQELGSVYFNSNGEIPDATAVRDDSIDPMYQDEWILQYEREVNDNWTAGVRYIYRDLSSTIDDILVDQGLEAMNARGEFQGPIGSSNDCHYVLTNPGSDVRVNCEWYIDPNDPSQGTELRMTDIAAEDLRFDEAERTYEAVEFTVDGAFDNWSVKGSYTWSKSKGNAEGYVKSDNGQDDAGLTTDWDIPEIMDGAYGYLPNDRRHKLKFWASYQVSDRLTLGTNFQMQSGRPINAFGESHPDGTPSYGDTYYIADGAGGFNYVPRGTAGRTDWITRIDLAAIYSMNLGDRADLSLRAEVFNLLNASSVREVYEFAESRPDQFRLPTSYQRPRYLRVGAELRFR